MGATTEVFNVFSVLRNIQQLGGKERKNPKLLTDTATFPCEADFYGEFS